MYDLNVISLSRSNTYKFKFLKKKIVLKPAKPMSTVGIMRETEKNNNTPCYLVTRSHFSPKSPIDGFTLRPRNSLSLLPLPLVILPIVTFEPSASHLHELHDYDTKQMTIDNYNYQSTIESHKRLQDLAVGDNVLIRVHLERFLLKTLKELHT